MYQSNRNQATISIYCPRICRSFDWRSAIILPWQLTGYLSTLDIYGKSAVGAPYNYPNSENKHRSDSSDSAIESKICTLILWPSPMMETIDPPLSKRPAASFCTMEQGLTSPPGADRRSRSVFCQALVTFPAFSTRQSWIYLGSSSLCFWWNYGLTSWDWHVNSIAFGGIRTVEWCSGLHYLSEIEL
jgi:hypothetical protein